MLGSVLTSRWLTIPILVALCAAVLSAQTRPPRKPAPHARIRQVSALSEKPTEPAQIVAFAHHAPSPNLQFSPKREGLFSPIARTFARQSVNLNLLMPPSGAPGWDSSKAAAHELATAFAADAPPPSMELPARFNDVQFYTRRIPGVAPIVDRFFQESKAHPQIVRILQYIHPKF